MLVKERQIQAKKNNKLVEVLLSIIKFLLNFSIDMWEK